MARRALVRLPITLPDPGGRPLTRAISFLPDPADGSWRSARACFAVGRPDDAGRRVRRALRLAPADPRRPWAGPAEPALMPGGLPLGDGVLLALGWADLEGLPSDLEQDVEVGPREHDPLRGLSSDPGALVPPPQLPLPDPTGDPFWRALLVDRSLVNRRFLADLLAVGAGARPASIFTAAFGPEVADERSLVRREAIIELHRAGWPVLALGRRRRWVRRDASEAAFMVGRSIAEVAALADLVGAMFGIGGRSYDPLRFGWEPARALGRALGYPEPAIEAFLGGASSRRRTPRSLAPFAGLVLPAPGPALDESLEELRAWRRAVRRAYPGAGF